MGSGLHITRLNKEEDEDERFPAIHFQWGCEKVSKKLNEMVATCAADRGSRAVAGIVAIERSCQSVGVRNGEVMRRS